MRARVNKIAGGGALLAFLAANLAVFGANAARADDSGRWIPGLAVVSGVTWQKMKSSVESMCALGGPPDPAISRTVPCMAPSLATPFELRPSASGSDTAVSAYVGGNLQLMTPSLGPIPGRPRVFAAGEVLAIFASTRDIASEAEPSGVALPPPVGNSTVSNVTIPAAALVGVGSRTTSEVQTLGFGANLGLAFPFEVRGFRLWVKPSAAWINYEVAVDGLVIAGLKDDPTPPVQPNFLWGANIRDVNLSAEDTITFNGIGPALELDLEVGRFGPIGASVFLGAAAYRVLGNRTVDLTDTKTLSGDNIPTDTYTARWHYEADEWVFRGGVGLRFHWLGSAR